MSDFALDTHLSAAGPDSSPALTTTIQRIILCLAFVAAAATYARQSLQSGSSPQNFAALPSRGKFSPRNFMNFRTRGS